VDYQDGKSHNHGCVCPVEVKHRPSVSIPCAQSNTGKPMPRAMKSVRWIRMARDASVRWIGAITNLLLISAVWIQSLAREPS